MITCKECIESLRPDDPRVRSGRYMMCGCDYCNKPTYYREIESANRETIIERQDLRPIKSEVNHILNKINTHIDASKSKRKHIYK